MVTTPKVAKRAVMPRANAPCYKCQDRFVTEDGHTCHESCEKYLKFREDRRELWEKVQSEVAKDRLVDECCVEMAMKNARKKRKAR